MKKGLFIALALFSFLFTSAQDGSSPANAFTDLGMVNDPGFTAGNYFFNISGTAFSTFVDDGGWVLLASSSASAGAANLSASTTMGLQTNQILPTGVYVGNATIIELRITGTSGPGTPLDVNTSDANMINNLVNNRVLTDGLGAGMYDVWNNDTGSRMWLSCVGSSTTLDQKIYHACNNGGGMHWYPDAGRIEVDYGAGDADLNLYVKSTYVAPVAIPTMGQWGLIILALLLLNAAVVLFFVKKRRVQYA